MSRICPATGDVVLYPECLECEDRGNCGKRKPNLIGKDQDVLNITYERGDDNELQSKQIRRQSF